MWKRQRKPGLGVVGYRKCGWAPPIDCVATLALAPVRPLRKLAFMGIRRVAIRADLVRKRSFEIFALMAGYAVNALMFTQQRKTGVRMIEPRLEAGPLPSRSRMAGIAALFEFALMRVAVTIGAAGEFQARPAWLTARVGHVAALALHCAMCASERVLRPGVIKRFSIDARRVPAISRVALCAIGP